MAHRPAPGHGTDLASFEPGLSLRSLGVPGCAKTSAIELAMLRSQYTSNGLSGLHLMLHKAQKCPQVQLQALHNGEQCVSPGFAQWS